MEVDEKRNMKEFDSYCKKVLRNEANNIQKELNRQRKHEISLSDLSETQLNQLFEIDDYIMDWNYFQILDEQIALKNIPLIQALELLDENKREIILLFYFLEMTDQKISELFELPRSTIQHRRSSALKEIKEQMEGNN